MTNDYRIVLSLMVATVGSVYIAHRFSPYSICTLRLVQRGITFPHGGEVGSSQEPDSTTQTSHQATAGSADK